MTETQGKVEASKDTVKDLNKKLEPLEVIMALDLFLHVYFASRGSILTTGVSYESVLKLYAMWEAVSWQSTDSEVFMNCVIVFCL